MKFIADLHIHSKYSRATSRDMDLEHISEYAKLKGIQLMATGDFTHHLWLEELKSKLKPKGNGLFEFSGTSFMLTAEVSNIYSKDGRGRRVHNIIFAPDFASVDKINTGLAKYGNLGADGRPMLGLECSYLVEIVKGINPNCLIIPAHAWTPWYSIFGANSGFDNIEECFGDYSSDIYAIETGLSSDPAMNWRLSRLDKIALISNSDAHSPIKIGREANVFDAPLDYREIIDAIKNKDKKRLLFTVEFFPQEGKYHFDGHRNCNILFSPQETQKHKRICPVCGRTLTVGVMNRVEQLSDRGVGYIPADTVPFKNLIPLDEIIAEAKGLGKQAQAVEREYRSIVQRMESEFNVLLDVPEKDLHNLLAPKIAQGIVNVRKGKVKITPGYDGVYGKIDIFTEGEDKKEKQMQLF